MVLNVRRNHKAYYNIRDGEDGGKEEREDYIPFDFVSDWHQLIYMWKGIVDNNLGIARVFTEKFTL